MIRQPRFTKIYTPDRSVQKQQDYVEALERELRRLQERLEALESRVFDLENP